MELQTEQLSIIGLTEEQFSLLLGGADKLEESLGLQITSEPLDKDVEHALRWLYEQGMADRDNFQWYTNWQIILKDAGMVLGSANFLGKPNEEGHVELTFGLHKFGRLRGYDEEALNAICNWALLQNGVKKVLISADKSDMPYLMIFEKCGFVLVEEMADMLLLSKS